MKSTHFIQLLLNCSRNQAQALLETASKEQVHTISLLIFNLTKNLNSITAKTKALLRKHKKIINKLCDKKLAEKSKYSIIRKHWADVYNLLISAKNVLSSALTQ